MAEVLGVVAGGAGLLSLSIQLLESAKKLKNFNDSVRNAPERLVTLGFELETLSLMLQQLEAHRQRDGSLPHSIT